MEEKGSLVKLSCQEQRVCCKKERPLSKSTAGKVRLLPFDVGFSGSFVADRNYLVLCIKDETANREAGIAERCESWFSGGCLSCAVTF